MAVCSVLRSPDNLGYLNLILYFLCQIESTQLEDPRQEWKSIQEHMLREYLTSAQDVLVAKKEIYDVKQQRLILAEDEYNLLNALAASRSSCKWTYLTGFSELLPNTNSLIRYFSFLFISVFVE